MSVAWQRLREPVVVLAITAFIALLSTSQQWAGLDTPDSSFYAALGIFGDAITDRAPVDSYYWTRLGYIVPVNSLYAVFGIWGSFFVWRLLLILVLTSSFYIGLRRFTGASSATFLTVIASLSSVVLSYLGNTYLTGTVMAGTAAATAAALFNGKRAAIFAGIALGWLVMVNPVGALLAGTLWLAVRIQARARNVQGTVRDFTATAAATIGTFVTFWIIGRVMFPGLDWFGTYFESNARIDYSNFASGGAVWLHDISLTVPVAITVTVVIAWITHRTAQAAQSALVISLVSLTFMLVFNPLMGGIPLEAPMYQSMLWPPALLALCLVTTMALPDTKWTLVQIIVGVVAVAVVIVAGHLALGLTLLAGWILAIAIVTIFLVSAYKRTIGAIAGLAVLLGGAQLLQNSRGDLGLYYLSPYQWAFASNPISDRIHTSVDVQQWLLANTDNVDDILTWVDGEWVKGDRELYVVAGMQLWGENRVTLESTLSDADGKARLDTYRPDVIAMYGDSMDDIMTFWQSLPPANRATVPECKDFPWTPNPASAFKITQGHACLTRLTWGPA